MSEQPIKEQSSISIQLEKSEYIIPPEGNTIITATLSNQGLEKDSYKITLEGVPVTWVSSSLPVIELSPGEVKKIAVSIQVPSPSEIATGGITITLRVTSLQHREQYSEVKAILMNVSKTVPSRIVIGLETTQITIAPGSSTTFGVTMKNNGLVADSLRLFINGISPSWVSTPSPITQLAPGEVKEVPLTISPPRTSESRVGRHPFTIRAVSQEVPDQAAEQECILTVGAYTKFSSELEPAMLEKGQSGQINLRNEGNVKEAYNIKWQSDEDLLAFELLQREDEEDVYQEVQEHTLSVQSGEQKTITYRGGLSKRPLLGGKASYPFRVLVSSKDDESVTHNGEIEDRALIPLWMVPVGLLLCIALVVIGYFIFRSGAEEVPPVAGDDSWKTVQAAGVLRVATSADYPPYSYYNQDYVIDGFDPALIREIGAKLGIQVIIADYAFEGLGATLQVGQADAVIAALSVTAEREKIVDFSNVYYVGEDGILARADSGIGTITGIGQFAGKRIGVQKLSVYETWVQETLIAPGIINQSMLFSYAKPEQAVAALKAGQIDLVMMDLQPAILNLSDQQLKLVGQKLNQQRFAIAIPKGASSLKAQIDQALLTLQNEGRVNQLAQKYLGLRPDDIIPPPTPVPTQVPTEIPTQVPTEGPTPVPTPVPCIDAMEFIKDLTLDDEDLTNFPKVYPGEIIQKGWRIKNSGTCVWNNSFFLKYVRGNDPAAQMGGQPTPINGIVQPGQTYDLYVNLVAPSLAGKYVGYWQMHNASNVPFGQTIWVAVQVRKIETPTPTATTAVNPTSAPPTATVPPAPTATPIPPEPTATEKPGSNLLDTTWILQEYLANMQDENLTEPIQGVDLDLIFNEDGNFYGFSGCNTYSGRYVTDGNKLAFLDILVTRVICDQPDGIMNQEAYFLDLLRQAEEYRINPNGQLEIIRYVIENNQQVEKIILLFYDQRIGPR